MIRFGVIGAGWFASRRHLPDIVKHPEAQLAAICRRDPEALEKLQAHFHPEQIYTDWRVMLEECQLDAIVIATPHNLHYEQALAALDRGLHVLMEKPMTVKSSEAHALCKLAREQNRVLAVALNPPYWSHCHRIRGAIQSGRLGEVESIGYFWTGNAGIVFGRVPLPEDLPGIVPPTMFRTDPEQNGGGYLIDGGSHLVSEILWVTGMRVASVSCQMDSLPVDNRAGLVLGLENGSFATIATIGDSRHKDRRVRNTIGCSDGTITVEGFDFLTTIQPEGGEPQSFSESDLPPVHGPVENFIDAIQGHGEVLSPGEHGAHVVEVIEAAYRSAETGKTIEISVE